MQVPQVHSPSYSFLVSSRERLNSGLQRYRASCHMTEPHGLPHHVTSMSQGTEAPNNNSENKHSNNMWYAACWRHYLEWNVDSGLWGGFLCLGSDLQPSVELCAHVACMCVNIRPNKHRTLMMSAWCSADLTPQLVCFCHFSFQAVHSAEQTARGGVQGASGEPGAGEVEGVCRAADAQGSTSALPEGAWGSGAMGALFAWAVCGHPGTRNTSDHISPGKLLETGTRCWIVVRSNDN